MKIRSAQILSLLLLSLALLLPRPAQSQHRPPARRSPTASSNPAREISNTVPALLLSDIHFDPFSDPGKVPQLAASPESEWAKILATPPRPDRQAALTALHRACGGRGADTSAALLQSTVQALKTQAADAKFVLIAGDLLGHLFDCRYTTLVPNTHRAGLADFTQKTLQYVINQVRAAVPGVPVYAALGNNDSACGDYRMDANGTFLASTAKILAEAWPESADHDKMLADFSAFGGYSTMMPAPADSTRLIVIDNIFQSAKFQNCTGASDSASVKAQIDWLTAQLSDARSHHQKAWVLGHIPPGIDLYTTITHLRNVCGGAKPEMFLSNEQMANTLADNADVVSLAIFGHTHMDEMRLLTRDIKGQPAISAVPAKLIPSISPIDGNYPAFTLARIDPATSTLADYRVVAASNPSEPSITWKEEYSFSKTYHESSFSAATVSHLLQQFAADPAAASPLSQSAVHNYFVGDTSSLIKPLWPQYVCAMAHHTIQGISACMCAQP